MCVVSMVSDHYRDKWIEHDDFRPNHVPWPKPISWPKYYPNGLPTQPSQADFDALKKEVEDMKALLIKAKKYDEDNNEPHCEMADKIAFVKKVADSVGVSLDDVFPT